VRTYTEQEIKDAWRSAAIHQHPDMSLREFAERFFRVLKKEEPVLFTKQDLLDVAAAEHEKVMIHGVFALLGTGQANESALISQAVKARLAGNMAIVLGLAKAKKEEEFKPGDVVRDANGTYFKLTAGRMWATFEHAMHLDFSAPVRPLEKMP